jgi:predicted nucleotidyltransferase
MDLLDEGLLQFWQVLNNNGVKYIMVGGFAVNMNGYIRATKDADLWLKDTLENRQLLRKSFAELGYGDYSSVETMEFAPGWIQFYIAGGMILDIMTSMKGLEDYSFEICYERASVADLGGIKVPFLHLNDLLVNKRIVNRPKDQLDVIYLEKIKQIRDEEENKANGS